MITVVEKLIQGRKIGLSQTPMVDTVGDLPSSPLMGECAPVPNAVLAVNDPQVHSSPETYLQLLGALLPGDAWKFIHPTEGKPATSG